MPPRIASLSDLLNSLDAATYFFVSSSMIIAVSAVLFFALGLWLGQILWRHYKRLFRQSEDAIESFKGEVALLKRRLAEQSTRPLPGMGPSPLQSIAFRAAAPRPAPPPGDKANALEVPLLPEVPVQTGNPASLRTESGEKDVPNEGKSVPSAGFQGWPQPSARRAVPGFAPKGTSTILRHPGTLLFAPSEVLMIPRSRAFCIWTESHWQPPAIRSAPTLPACGFALWTEPEFEPGCTGPRWPSKAHTVWTSPGWTSSYKPGPTTRSARAFTVWMESDWKPAWSPKPSKAFSIWTENGWIPTPVSPQRLLPANSFTLWTESGWTRLLLLPWSKAFSLWTDPEWSPSPAKSAPLPASAAGSLWISSEFEPACRGAVPASCAFTKWTEKGWSPPSMRRQPLPAGKPFTLWVEPSPIAAEKQGFLARTLAAAKQALGLGDTESSVATQVAVAPADAANNNPAAAETPREEEKLSAESGARVAVGPLPAGPLPPSGAFTLWGEVPGKGSNI